MKKQFGYLLLSAAFALTACNKKQEAPPPPAPQPTNPPAASSSIGNPLTAPVDYLSTIAKAQKSAVKTIDTVSLNNAVQLFQVQEGRYPTDLNELVTKKYIGRIPATPYGTKLEYDAAKGQVKVVKQ